MTRKIIPVFIFFTLSSLFFCCKRYLTVLTIAFMSAADQFTCSLRTEYFINNAYTDMPADVANSFNRLDGAAMLASASDEAMHISTNKTTPSAAQKMSSGNWDASNMRYYVSSDGA